MYSTFEVFFLASSSVPDRVLLCNSRDCKRQKRWRLKEDYYLFPICVQLSSPQAKNCKRYTRGMVRLTVNGWNWNIKRYGCMTTTTTTTATANDETYRVEIPHCLAEDSTAWYWKSIHNLIYQHTHRYRPGMCFCSSQQAHFLPSGVLAMIFFPSLLNQCRSADTIDAVITHCVRLENATKFRTQSWSAETRLSFVFSFSCHAAHAIWIRQKNLENVTGCVCIILVSFMLFCRWHAFIRRHLLVRFICNCRSTFDTAHSRVIIIYILIQITWGFVPLRFLENVCEFSSRLPCITFCSIKMYWTVFHTRSALWWKDSWLSLISSCACYEFYSWQ